MSKKEELTYNIQLSELALKLRRLRLSNRFSIAEVAVACKIKPDKLLDYENDRELPTKQKLKVLAEFYKVGFNDLLPLWKIRCVGNT